MPRKQRADPRPLPVVPTPPVPDVCAIITPARIIRFVQVPMRDVRGRAIASFDESTNVLLVDRPLFDLLEPWQQNQIIHTRASVYLEHFA